MLAEFGWNGPALQNAFRWGLSDQVHDELVSGARPKDLDELIVRAIKMDNYQRERC